MQRRCGGQAQQAVLVAPGGLQALRQSGHGQRPHRPVQACRERAACGQPSGPCGRHRPLPLQMDQGIGGRPVETPLQAAQDRGIGRLHALARARPIKIFCTSEVPS